MYIPSRLLVKNFEHSLQFKLRYFFLIKMNFPTLVSKLPFIYFVRPSVSQSMTLWFNGIFIGYFDFKKMRMRY